MVEMAQQGLFQTDAIRGRFPADFGESRAVALGGAVAAAFGGGVWVVGRDNRLTSRSLHWLIVRGLSQAGVEVMDLGLCSVQMLTFAVVNRKAAGGVFVTGGEGAQDITGLRIWKKGAVPAGADSGLLELRTLWDAGGMETAVATLGHIGRLDIHPEYLGDLMKFADDLKPFSVMADLGSGLMGHFLPGLFEKLPCELMDVRASSGHERPNAAAGREPDATGAPGATGAGDCFCDPQLLSRGVKESIADVGVAFSADGGACRLLCENGDPIAFCATAALLASYLLQREPGGAVVCTPRDWRVLARATQRAGGRIALSACGSVAVSAVMRQEEAVLGCDGEGGFYFRDTHYAANPELALLEVLALLSREGVKLSDLVRMQAAPSVRDEIALDGVSFADAAVRLEAGLGEAGAFTLSRVDGLAGIRDEWGFWLRLNEKQAVVLEIEAESGALLRQVAGEIRGWLRAGGR